MKYWDKITEIYKKQTEKGIKTYGVPLEEENALDFEKCMRYFQEELVDGLMYSEHALELNRKMRNSVIDECIKAVRDGMRLYDTQHSSTLADKQAVIMSLEALKHGTK